MSSRPRARDRGVMVWSTAGSGSLSRRHLEQVRRDAELLDPPYFNLWSGTASNGPGDGATVSLCGVANCTTGAGGSANGWAIFRTCMR